MNSLFPSFYLPFDSLPPSTAFTVLLSPPLPSLAVKQIALWKPVAFHLHWETLSGRKPHTAFYPALQPAPSVTSTHHPHPHPHPCLLSSSLCTVAHNFIMLICALRLEQSSLNFKNLFLILKVLFLLCPHTLCPAEISVGWIKCPLAETPSITLPIDSPLLSFTPIFLFFSCEWYWAAAHIALGKTK